VQTERRQEKEKDTIMGRERMGYFISLEFYPELRERCSGDSRVQLKCDGTR
jgi:hypothetical protein